MPNRNAACTAGWYEAVSGCADDCRWRHCKFLYMPSNNLFTKLKKLKWVDSLKNGLNREESVIRNRIVPELQSIVNNFDTDIPITYEKIEQNGQTIFRIGPNDGVYFTRETDGASIPVSALFDWLNDGTDVSHALIIGDYKSESSPNSLETSNQDNSNVKIYVSKEFDFPGIEARNWTRLLRDKYQSEIERSFISGIKQFLRGK